jgi:hypothetical protein
MEEQKTPFKKHRLYQEMPFVVDGQRFLVYVSETEDDLHEVYMAVVQVGPGVQLKIELEGETLVDAISNCADTINDAIKKFREAQMQPSIVDPTGNPLHKLV